MRRLLWIVIPAFLLIAILRVAWFYGERRISAFIVSTAQHAIKKTLSWDLEVKDLAIQLIPPQIIIQEFKLSPPKETHWISPLAVRSIIGHLDFLNLMGGQIKFSLIHLTNLNSNLVINEIPSSQTPMERLPISEIFDTLDLIPVKMVLLDKTRLTFRMSEKDVPVPLEGNYLLQSERDAISYGIKSSLSLPLENETTAQVKILSKGTLSSRSLFINNFELLSKDSKFAAQGEFNDFANVIRKPDFSGVSDIRLNTNDIGPWLKWFWPEKVPALKGEFRAQGRVKIQNWKSPELEMDTKIINAGIGDFELGDLTTKLSFINQNLKAEETHYVHPAGELTLKEFKWNVREDEVQSKVSLKTLDLQKLFQQIHLDKIPVELLVAAELKCHGKLLHAFALDCDGGVQGSKLDVRSEYHGSGAPIIALKTFSGEGSVRVDTEAVTYKSTIVLPLSIGQTQGTVNYKTGFVIDFDTDKFDFQDASPLAGLVFQGTGKLRGRTQGNSDSATLEIALGTKDFWFENFGLGNIEGKINYQKGHLIIDAPKGQLRSSLYVANVDVNLVDSQIKGFVESSHFQADDAIVALSRRVPIPFTASGTGKVRAQFEGPFALGGLTYQFEGLFEKGDIQGETFDELAWNLNSKNGNVKIVNNTIRKGNALIEVNGKALPTGHLALDVQGTNFKLENSSYLSRYVKTLGGDVDFHMSINNHILRPDIFLESKIEHTTLGDSELPDSKIIFETDSLGRSLSLDLIGHQIRMELELPYGKSDQARLFMEVQKFDFTDFLALITGSPLRNDYKSLLSLRVDIQSDNNDIFAASGLARIDDFYLSRSEHFLRNNKPMFVYFKEGLATLKDFSIKGYQSELTATGTDFSPSKLKLNFGGSMDLRLIQLFTPFLDDISGPVRGQIRISGNLSSPEIYGNLDLSEVAVKIKGFPPLFDHINSHLEFSQKRIIIESIRGSLAGGSLAGDGTITINGLKDVPVSIRTQLRNVQLEVPERVQSSGSADLVISGNWFPYTLSGTYRVSQAFIDKDFTSDSAANNVRQSIYLPKNIASSGFDPIILDLQLLLDKKIEVKNPQMSGFLSGQLQIKGPPQSPVLFGSIRTLPMAQLFFRDKVFDIQSGVIRFNDPLEINPELYFAARSIVDKYEINLLLQGKSKTPQLSLTSQPPLQEQDIISLLALGVTTQKLDSQIQSSQQAAQTGYQLGTAIISANPLNKEIKQSLGVDVKFSSGFDDTKNVALPRVTVSKDLIPRRLNASATSTFSENQRYDVRFQYLLNDRISTVVTYEKAEGQDANATAGANQPQISIFGLDLEYKVQFK